MFTSISFALVDWLLVIYESQPFVNETHKKKKKHVSVTYFMIMSTFVLSKFIKADYVSFSG